MTPEQRSELHQILQAIDENGLIALANKGLVRRASKDLEAGGLSYEETATALLVRGSDWTVTMPPEGPTEAKDDTTATGISRQILTATMYLRDNWQGADEIQQVAPTVTPATKSTPLTKSKAAESKTLPRILLDVSSDDLQKWAGKTIFREALPVVRAQPKIEVETHAGVLIRLIEHEMEARLLPGVKFKSAAKLLDQILTTAPKTQHKRWVVISVLAYQQSQGKTLTMEETSVAADARGAPRTRARILTSTRELLESMTVTGIAHPSQRMVERLETLAVSATGVHLPRLTKLLRGLADNVQHILMRTAQGETSQLFDRLCFTHALTRALQAAGAEPPFTLAGRHRTEYEPTGDLLLTGVGAYPWRTASGYEGVTVLLWDAAGSRFLTYTASRPINNPGRFDVQNAYRESVWQGGGSPEQLSRSLFLLRDARVNPEGRISASQKSSVEAAELTDPDKIPFGHRVFEDWSVLIDYARSIYPIGLAERNVLDRYVILRPASWGERVFEEVEQCLLWHILDKDGRALEISLPWTGINEQAIAFCEAVNPSRDKLTGVVTRIQFDDKGLHLEPLSLLSAGTPQGDRVLNPAFDHHRIKSRHSALLERLRKKYGRDRIATTLRAEDDDAAHSELNLGSAAYLSPILNQPLAETEYLILRVAESGVHSFHDMLQDRCRKLARSFERTGFHELGQSLNEMCESPSTPSGLLWAGYLCRLHREAIGMRGCVADLTGLE